jgi:hypothetical protein
VLARLERADEPRLPSVSPPPLADGPRVNDALRATPAKTPRFLDTADRPEPHMTLEVRDRQHNWLRDVQFVRGA